MRLAISIHVPREGHDGAGHDIQSNSCYFYPRAPRGARRIQTAQPHQPVSISIHVPREGHDYKHEVVICRMNNFYPRAPRGARLAT